MPRELAEDLAHLGVAAAAAAQLGRDERADEAVRLEQRVVLGDERAVAIVLRGAGRHLRADLGRDLSPLAHATKNTSHAPTPPNTGKYGQSTGAR